MRSISATVGAVFVAGSLAACGSSDITDAAKSKANDLKASATAMAASAAASAAADISGKSPEELKQQATDLLNKLSPETKQKLQGAVDASDVKADLGSYSDEPTATLTEEYFAARQAALTSHDLSALKAIATPKMAAKAKKYVKKHSKRAGKPFVITVVGQDASGTQVCVGPKGKRAKVIVTNAKGKVSAIRKGTHTC
jgi:hypothetical protein